MSERTRRIRRAILPAGLALLAVWIVWHGFLGLAGELGRTTGLVTPVLSLISVLLLIVTGWEARRHMASGH